MTDVTYNDGRTHVACVECSDWIERGTDFAVRLYFPEDTNRENPIGPYCESCIVNIKVCCGCNKGYHIDKTDYVGNGKYYCDECMESMEICSSCGSTGEEFVLCSKGKKYCPSCVDNKLIKCTRCDKYRRKGYRKKSALRYIRPQGRGPEGTRGEQ